MAQTVIEGRRVTDDDTLELAKMIFAGKINTEIFAALRRRGIPPSGFRALTETSFTPKTSAERDFEPKNRIKRND